MLVAKSQIPIDNCAGGELPRGTQLCLAGAVAIGGFVRSRRRGGAMGFAWAIRDLFVEWVGWTER